MENNENQFNPIARAREKANLSKTQTGETPTTEEKFIKAEPFDTENVVVEPVAGELNTENVVDAKIVPEEPKQKKLRIINSNDIVISPDEVQEGKKIAWLAYILFFIPLFIKRNNGFVRHNVNEGLEIFIVDVIASVLLILNAVIKTTSVFWDGLLLVGSVIGIALLILTTITKIYMIIISLLGKKVNTPWFWNIRMIS